MDNTKKDRGPAFPGQFELPIHPEDSRGMTLRNWFMGRIITGMIANESMLQRISDATDGADADLYVVQAAMARKLADVMVEESTHGC